MRDMPGIAELSGSLPLPWRGLPTCLDVVLPWLTAAFILALASVPLTRSPWPERSHLAEGCTIRATLVQESGTSGLIKAPRALGLPGLALQTLHVCSFPVLPLVNDGGRAYTRC